MATPVKALAIAALLGLGAALSAMAIPGKAPPAAASTTAAAPTPAAGASKQPPQATVVGLPMPNRPPMPASESRRSLTPTPSPTPAGPVMCNADAEVRFVASPLDLDGIGIIRPMGGATFPHITPPNEIYIINKDPWRVPDPFVVRSPAAGRIVEIARSGYNQKSPDGSVMRRDYRIIVAHSCTKFSIFIHVAELAPEIAAVTGDLPRNGKWSPRPGEGILVEAGQVIAGFNPYSVDYTLVDTEVALIGLVVP